MSTRTPTRPAPPTGTATPSLARRLPVEALGTFWLVLAGCGTAVLAGDEVGFVGISLAFGLAVLTMAYAVGHVSGAHFNPAVSVGLAVAGRFRLRDVPGYVVAQVAGGRWARSCSTSSRRAAAGSPWPTASPPTGTATCPRPGTRCSPSRWPRPS